MRTIGVGGELLVSDGGSGRWPADQAEPPSFPSAWGSLAGPAPHQPAGAIQVPSAWQDSLPVDTGPAEIIPASVSRDLASGLVDVATIILCSALVVSLFTPVRVVLGLTPSARNVARREAVSSLVTDQDFSGFAMQIVGLQALLILILTWIVAVPLTFAYSSLSTTILGGTLGRLATRTRLRTDEGLPLRGGAVAKYGLAAAFMWLLPPLVLANTLVFVSTFGGKRLRVGQRMSGTHAVVLTRKWN